MKKQEGNIIININDKNILTNSFNDEKLSDELGNYILKSAMQYKISDKLKIIIDHDNLLSNEEELKLKRMIITYYNEQINYKKKLHKFSAVIDFLTFLIGILFICLYYLFFYYNIPIISEILLIIGWVAIWEWAYKNIFIDTKNLFKIEKYKQIIQSKIIFKK